MKERKYMENMASPKRNRKNFEEEGEISGKKIDSDKKPKNEGDGEKSTLHFLVVQK
jgi:hypothetical protein